MIISFPETLRFVQEQKKGKILVGETLEEEFLFKLERKKVEPGML